MKLKSIFSSLQRVTTKGNFIPEVDGLRFLAIFPVLLAHSNTNYIRVFGEGEKPDLGIFEYFMNRGGIVGVWIFFAISGFILSLSFANHFHIKKKTYSDLELKSFYIRRLTRLEPPFLISTIVLFIFVGIFVTKGFQDLWPNLWATLTYSHYLVFGERSPINPVSWSLETEIQFYLISPFVCAFLFRLSELLRNCLIILGILVIPYLVYALPNSPFIEYPILSRTLPAFLSHFLIGILFSSLFTSSLWKKIKEKNSIWDFLVFLSIIGCFVYVPDSKDISTFYLFDLFVFIIMIGTFKGKLFKKIFSNKILTSIGGMCYSIYLIHYAVIFGVSMFIKNVVFGNVILNYSFQMICYVLTALCVSIVFYIFCERPFMFKDWPNKFWNYINKK